MIKQIKGHLDAASTGVGGDEGSEESGDSTDEGGGSETMASMAIASMTLNRACTRT